MHLLDTRLRHFLKCAESASFQAAARSLGMTQGALSIAIGKLEKELRTKLFERHGRGIELTVAGQKLYEQLNAAERALRSGIERATASDEARPLRIGCVSHFGVKYFMPFMRADQSLSRTPCDFIQYTPGDSNAGISKGGSGDISVSAVRIKEK